MNSAAEPQFSLFDNTTTQRVIKQHAPKTVFTHFFEVTLFAGRVGMYCATVLQCYSARVLAFVTGGGEGYTLVRHEAAQSAVEGQSGLGA